MKKSIKFKNKSEIVVVKGKRNPKGFNQLRDEGELREIFKKAKKRIRKELRKLKNNPIIIELKGGKE